MKQRKIPLRMCVVTREKLEKKELLRIVRTPEGIVEIDTTGKMNGKGAYVKKELEVIEKAKKSKVLDRVLEVSIPDTLYDKMKEFI